MGPTKVHKHINSGDIANAHGCDIQPGAFGQKVLVVQRRYQQGHPQDETRIRECLAALKAAGIDTVGWLS